MWRTLLLAVLAALVAQVARAAPVASWEVCRGPGPAVTDCRPVDGERIDPQGRELWVRASVGGRRPGEMAPSLYLAGAMSTEAWFNGVRIGANGQPGASPADEDPGDYQAAIPIDPGLWRSSGNVLVLRMSAFHTGFRYAHPVGGVWIGDGSAQIWAVLAATLAVTCVTAGVLLAAAFGFGAVFAIRRTGSSLMLAALAGVAALQAGVENIRNLVAYPYPLHAWRVGAIWALAAVFAMLLVAYFAARFAPRQRRWLLMAAGVLVPLSFLWPGFDQKTSLALAVGVLVSGVAAAFGWRARMPGARLALAYFAAFLALALMAPGWLLDLSFFLLAAALVLPLLVADVVRLGRDDRDREAALTKAASRPDRLTVATARGVELVPLKDIVAILGADDYVDLRLACGRSVLHAARLERLAAQLPEGFLRVHRSAIANLAHAERLEREGARWRLHMRDGAALAVSRSRLAPLRDALDPEPLAASA